MDIVTLILLACFWGFFGALLLLRRHGRFHPPQIESTNTTGQTRRKKQSYFSSSSSSSGYPSSLSSSYSGMFALQDMRHATRDTTRVACRLCIPFLIACISRALVWLASFVASPKRPSRESDLQARIPHPGLPVLLAGFNLDLVRLQSSFSSTLSPLPPRLPLGIPSHRSL